MRSLSGALDRLTRDKLAPRISASRLTRCWRSVFRQAGHRTRVLLGAKADFRKQVRNEHGEVAQQSAEFADTEPSVRSPQPLSTTIVLLYIYHNIILYYA